MTWDFRTEGFLYDLSSYSESDEDDDRFSFAMTTFLNFSGLILLSVSALDLAFGVILSTAKIGFGTCLYILMIELRNSLRYLLNLKIL